MKTTTRSLMTAEGISKSISKLKTVGETITKEKQLLRVKSLLRVLVKE